MKLPIKLEQPFGPSILHTICPKGIFDAFEDMRLEWGNMFSALGGRMDPKTRSEFVTAFGKKFEEYLVKSIEKKYKIDRYPAKWIERKKGKSRFTILKWSLDYLYWYFYAFKIRLNKNKNEKK